MLVKIPVEDVVRGMYVEELDCDWTATCFPFQGFLVRTEGDMSKLRRYCRHVFVNDAKSRREHAVLRRIEERLRPHTRRSAISEITFERWEGESRLKRTLEELQELSGATGDAMKELYSEAASRYKVDSNRVSLIAGDIYRALEKNPRLGKWVAMMQTRGGGVAEHCRNVAVLAMGFARHLGKPEYLVALIGEGALLHDIGLSRVPHYVRERAGPLQEREMGLVRLHPTYARDCLQSYLQVPPEIADIIELHHARLDGSGYPPEPTGDVPDYVYIVAICDVFETMSSFRRYKKPHSPEEALIELDRMAGRKLPGNLVQEFISYVGIYPRGDFVMLENGAVGIVVFSTRNHRTRPVLRMVRGPGGSPSGSEFIDLSTMDGAERDAGWRIQRSVHPMDMPLDVEDARQKLLAG